MDSSITIHALKITDADFERIVRANPDWNFEQTAEGELIVVPPTGGTSGRKNRNLTGQFSNWVEQNLELGEGFDSSTLFILPNGAKRSPDASWVTRERWDALSPKQQDGYPFLCPDFVVELRSPTDSLEELRAKMREYMDNGTRLGWLIDPQNRQVEIYRFRHEVAESGRNYRDGALPVSRPTFQEEVLQSPTSLSGEDVLPGFVLDLQPIFA